MNEQPTTRNLDNDIPSKTCRLRHKEGIYYLVRRGPSKSRVANLEPPRGTGFKVKTSDVFDIQVISPVAQLASKLNSGVLPREPQWYHQPAYTDMPYGIKDVLPKVIRDGERIKCYIKDCNQFLLPPKEHRPGELCPHHGIYSHGSRTFTYPKQEAYRNVIADRTVFEALNNHTFKWESRCHNEGSEDAVTASVFLSLREAGCLHEVVRWLTGKIIPEAEIQLYLWGINVQTLEPSALLVAARNRFETGLPHGRPSSEPDCMLWVPGKLLLIIEAKLASSNTYVIPGKDRKSPISLTHEEVLNRYNDLQIWTIDYPLAAASPVPQQLFRYWQFGSWMAMMSDPGAEFHLCNLTRKGWEIGSQDDFRTLIRQPFRDRFHVMSWEDIYGLSSFYRDRLARLRTYLENKSLNLRQAFQLGRIWNGV